MISVYKDFNKPPGGLVKGKGWRDDSVTDELFGIYHGKCAYSEEKIEPIMQPPIMHYRAFSLYPWLENEWSNLLPLCPGCKRVSSDLFPISGKRVEKAPSDKALWHSDSKGLLAEEPKLLHPEIDTPENHLYFDPNGIIYGRTDRGKTTIEAFDLNRQGLLDKRREKINAFREKFEQMYKEFVHYYSNIDQAAWKKGRRRFDGKLVHDVLFKNVFLELKQAGEARSEFTLLGRNMLENVPGFFSSYFYSMENTASDRNKELLKIYQRLLMEAAAIFTGTDNIIKFKKTEKRIPYHSEDAALVKALDEKALPIAIKAFEIHKYHGIKFTRIEKIPLNTRWIFLTGENGFGKTLALQALAIGLNGKEDKGVELAGENCRVEIEFKRFNDNIINIADGEVKIGLKNLATYGPGRLNIDGDIFEGKQAPEKLRKTDSLFQNTPSLYNIQEYLIQLHGRKPFESKFTAIIKTLKQLLPWVEEIVVDESAEKKKILYRESTENGDILDDIPFGALSAGSRSIIATIGDMLIELLKHQEVDDPADLGGIVIIDEIDIHLHAKWQREFVTRLTTIFPKIQFIASTHSPIPLLGAPAETVILNVDKETKIEGIVVKRLDIDVKNLTPNTILTSPVFDFQRIIPQANDKREQLHTQDDYSEVVFNKMLKNKLDRLAKEGGKSLADLMRGTDVD